MTGSVASSGVEAAFSVLPLSVYDIEKLMPQIESDLEQRKHENLIFFKTYRKALDEVKKDV